MKRFNANLIPFPAMEAADNEVTYCVRLSERDIQLILSQTEYLHWAKRYTETSAIAPDELRDIVDAWASQVEARLMAFTEDCPTPIETCCEQFVPEQDWIAFFPNDPFTTPDYVPEGYLLPPFYTNPVLLPFDSRRSTDAILNFASFPLFQNIAQLIETGLPRFRINFEGSGQVEVEILKVVNGGYALIQLDDNPANDQVIDCNQFTITDLADLEEFIDIVIEGKLVQTEIVEFNIESGGAHHIDCYFLPNIGLDILLGWGGGLRSVEFCNGVTAGENFTMQMRTIEVDETCREIQWRPNSTAAWIPLTTVCDGAAGAAGTDAPPLHMGFDAENCRLMYTQGNIASPYDGGDWNTVFDWNIASLKDCLGLIGGVEIVPDDLIESTTCNIAYGMASLLIEEVRELVQFDLDNGPYASKLTFAAALIGDGSFWFGSNWNALPFLMNWANSYGVPSIGMIDEIEAPDTLTYIAQAIYCSLVVGGGGSISLDRDELASQLATYDTIFATDASSAIMTWIIRNTNERLQNHLNQAAATSTGHDCADLDCYLLPTCIDYVDDMQGGLGARTRLFDASHAWARDGAAAVSSIVPTGGISGGAAVRMDDNNGGGGGGLWVGGLFVDLGRECTVNLTKIWYKVATTPVNASLDVDLRNDAGGLVHSYHLSVSGVVTTAYQSWQLSPISWAGVRYVVFRADSQGFAGAGSQILLANPEVGTA